MRDLIVCSKCGHTAKKLFYQTRINGYKQSRGTDFGYCETCKRYEIPPEIIRPKQFINLVDKVVLQ